MWWRQPSRLIQPAPLSRSISKSSAKICRRGRPLWCRASFGIIAFVNDAVLSSSARLLGTLMITEASIFRAFLPSTWHGVIPCPSPSNLQLLYVVFSRCIAVVPRQHGTNTKTCCPRVLQVSPKYSGQPTTAPGLQDARPCRRFSA